MICCLKSNIDSKEASCNNALSMGKEKDGKKSDKYLEKKKLSKKERKRRKERFEKEKPKTKAFEDILLEREDFNELYPLSPGEQAFAAEDTNEEIEEAIDPTRSRIGKFDEILVKRYGPQVINESNGIDLVENVESTLPRTLSPFEIELFSNLPSPLLNRGGEIFTGGTQELRDERQH